MTRTPPSALKPTIGILAPTNDDARACADAIERLDGHALRIDAADAATPERALRLIDALVCCGGDAREADDQVRLLRAALDDDLPIYAIGGGMLLLNIALGGKPAVSMDDHAATANDGEAASAYHQIYIAPGSRLAAVVGSGGFVRVNSRHRSGIREAHKSPWLLASAYSLEDSVIEALESPRHRWVIGVQFRPEHRMELPPHFDRLFQSLLERAAERLNAASFPQ